MTDISWFQRTDETHHQRLARLAKALGVPLRNATVKDDWFMSNLSYGVDQEIAAAEARLDDLRKLQGLYTA